MCQGPVAEEPAVHKCGRRPEWLECRGTRGSKVLIEAGRPVHAFGLHFKSNEEPIKGFKQEKAKIQLAF